MSANQLSLNIAKTYNMIFRSSRKKTEKNIDVCLDGKVIEKLESTKFIGVTIDSTLTWAKHIQNVRNKISRGLGIIIRARKFFDTQILITLYNSFIYPYFIYCIEVWGKAADTHLSSLFKIQKKIVRILKSAPYLAETKPIFKELKLLPLNGVYRQRLNLFMFKFIKGMLPNMFNDLFIRNSDLKRRSTRQDYQLKIPLCKTALFQKTVRYQGVKEWNFMFAEIDHFCSVHSYKKRLKSYLLNLL